MNPSFFARIVSLFARSLIYLLVPFLGSLAFAQQENVSVPKPNAAEKTQQKWGAASYEDLQKAAQAGDPEAEYFLGITDFGKADAESNQASQWAVRVFNTPGPAPTAESAAAKWGKATLEEVRRAADTGDRDAMQQMYFLELDRIHVKTLAAFEWVHKAADQNLVIAISKMGMFYAIGGVVHPDSAESYKWFKKAADLGNEPAQHQIALMLLEGSGLRAGPVEGIKWLRQAAAQGCPLAQYQLARYYRCGIGEPQDDGETPIALYRKAATQGFARAEMALADRYRSGLGLEPDIIQSIAWYRATLRTSFSHLPAGSHPYGFLADHLDRFDRGQEILSISDQETDQSEASERAQAILSLADRDPNKINDPELTYLAEWSRTFVKAIDHHDATAQWQIGRYYLEGTKVKRDQIEALAWFTLAADQNYKPAEEARAALKTKLAPNQVEDAMRRSLAWKTR